MQHGRYGQFQVLVDGTVVAEGGKLTMLGLVPSGANIVAAVREALHPPRPAA